jgi:hypothetical protein
LNPSDDRQTELLQNIWITIKDLGQNLGSRIDQTNARLDALTVEVRQVKTEVTELKTEVTRLGGRFDHFLGFLGKEVGDLKTRVTTLEVVVLRPAPTTRRRGRS